MLGGVRWACKDKKAFPCILLYFFVLFMWLMHLFSIIMQFNKYSCSKYADFHSTKQFSMDSSS